MKFTNADFFSTHDEGVVYIGNRYLSSVEEANDWVAFSYEVVGSGYVAVMKRRPEKERIRVVEAARRTIKELNEPIIPMKLYSIVF